MRPLGAAESHSAQHQAVHLLPLLALILDLVEPGQAVELVVLFELGNIGNGGDVGVGKFVLGALDVVCEVLLDVFCR